MLYLVFRRPVLSPVPKGGYYVLLQEADAVSRSRKRII